MLIEDYYTIISLCLQGDTAVFTLHLNPDCKVYEGHFPGTPVSPGVCNIQMLKECLEALLGKRVLLHNIQQCRLTVLVTPIEYPQVEARIEIVASDEQQVKFHAVLGNHDQVYLDLKAEAKILSA
ncbi:MAG: hypothetical protein NC038_02495 [Paludibacter sp.]|nr:hypothetical protein [Bacteroidales bacterium]MCM1068949.1 hypothetical protein [Prevotella sp.]MCM1353612.1 hypothetical protein [Bacteroides sp.]MCM1442039.1 hypothetical protein [Muribaculum sp.]MCM1481505.1 hypothetical protein [Paludibacter sp.]